MNLNKEKMEITIKINTTNPIDAESRKEKLQSIALVDDKCLALFHEIATKEKFRKKFVANEKTLRLFAM
jgi:hypothetical protein